MIKIDVELSDVQILEIIEQRISTDVNGSFCKAILSTLKNQTNQENVKTEYEIKIQDKYAFKQKKIRSYIVEFPPNENLIIIHTKNLISTERHYFKHAKDFNSLDYKPEIKGLVNAVIICHGIKKVDWIDKYEMSITKAYNFDWEQLLPPIIKELDKFFGLDDLIA